MAQLRLLGATRSLISDLRAGVGPANGGESAPIVFLVPMSTTVTPAQLAFRASVESLMAFCKAELLLVWDARNGVISSNEDTQKVITCFEALRADVQKAAPLFNMTPTAFGKLLIEEYGKIAPPTHAAVCAAMGEL